MSKPSVTEAKDLNTEVVLELSKFYSSKDLRNLQTKLTGTSRELRGLISGNALLGRIGEKLSFEQRQLLQDAAKLIESVNANIGHAKEKRKRTENDAKRRQQARNAHARSLVAETFTLPGKSLDQQLDILKTVLTFNRAGIFKDCYSPPEFNLNLRACLAPSYICKLIGWDSPQAFWKNKLLSLRFDFMVSIEHEIAYDDGSSTHDRLNALKQKVADCISRVPLTVEEEETLRLWLEALSPEGQQGGDQ